MNYESMSDYELRCEAARIALPCDYVCDDESQTVSLVNTVTYLGAHGEPYERVEAYAEFNPSRVDAIKAIDDGVEYGSNNIGIECDTNQCAPCEVTG